MKKRMNERTNVQTNEQTKKCSNEWMNELTKKSILNFNKFFRWTVSYSSSMHLTWRLSLRRQTFIETLKTKESKHHQESAQINHL